MDTRYERYGVKKKEIGEVNSNQTVIVHVKPASLSIIGFRGARVTSPMVSRELEVGSELARGGVRTYQNSDMSCMRAGCMRRYATSPDSVSSSVPGELLSSRVVIVWSGLLSSRDNFSPYASLTPQLARVSAILCEANSSACVTISVLALCGLLSSPEFQPFCVRRTPHLA
ncbi:hypothetical protein ACLB2K_006817 [Fragaria x ananassa]